jgi:glutathione S-transferase
MTAIESDPRRRETGSMLYFYAVPTCSLAGMIALEATGATYEAVAIDLAGDRSAYLEVNRSGKVPALQAGDQVVTDTIAIIYWLAKRFPHAGLLPTDDSSLAASLSVMAWFGSVVHVLRRQYTRPAMFCDGA